MKDPTVHDLEHSRSNSVVSNARSRSELFVARLRPTLLTAASKIFLGGFFWQVLYVVATAAELPHEIMIFASCGFGEALGVVLGLAILEFLASKGVTENPPVPFNLESFRVAATQLACAAFSSGTVWQPALNFSQNNGLNFEFAMAFVGVVCATCFFLGMQLGRIVTNSLARARSEENLKTMDATLAVSVGYATAFFVGTDSGYTANWLQPAVGERAIYNASEFFEDCLRAGFSTFLGFSFCQIFLLNWTSRDGANWADIE